MDTYCAVVRLHNTLAVGVFPGIIAGGPHFTLKSLPASGSLMAFAQVRSGCPFPSPVYVRIALKPIFHWRSPANGPD